MDVVASHRAAAYCNYFVEYGILPTLITNRWELSMDSKWKYHTDDDSIIIEEDENCSIIRLPRLKPRMINSLLSKFYTVFHYLVGNLDVENYYLYKQAKNYLYRHLETNHYDLVIAMYSPHFDLKLAFEINQKYGISYILDFRDLWDNQIVTTSYRPTFKQKILNTVVSYYWRKWLKSAIMFTATSKIWIDYLEKLSGVNGHMIRNGHELSNKSTLIKQNNCFKIVCFGRLYPNMEYDVILLALKRFLTYERELPIILEMIGIKRTTEFDGKSYFKANLNTDKLVFKESMPKDELMNYCEREATVFILPNFPEDNGQFMVKLYDYLALGSPVILAPSNGSDMEHVLKDVNGGIVTSNVDEMVNYLQDRYDELSENGRLSYVPNINKIESYHRKYQVARMAKLINDRLN
jgi:glycosyltransferase involved in cell wall biosynthesis